jgi:aldose 1-epimerase
MTASAPNPLDDPTATRIAAGDFEAIFLPGHGMLGISLRYKDVEVLRRVDDLKTYAAKNRTAGIPFLFPWANRLAGFHYEAAGRAVTLEKNSPLLRYDDNRLPMHGMMWPHLAWTIVEASEDRLSARFDGTSAQCLAVFPYPCQLAMSPSLGADGLTVETTLSASGDVPVPVSFGFHPYLGLPELPRQDWRVHLPPMRHLVLAKNKIPTGAAEPFGGLEDALGTRDFDDGFALLGDKVTLSVSAARCRISMELLEGYPFTQVYAPHDKDYLAFEPMTAPANALISGDGLRFVQPGETFRATFRIRVESIAA